MRGRKALGFGALGLHAFGFGALERQAFGGDALRFGALGGSALRFEPFGLGPRRGFALGLDACGLDAFGLSTFSGDAFNFSALGGGALRLRSLRFEPFGFGPRRSLALGLEALGLEALRLQPRMLCDRLGRSQAFALGSFGLFGSFGLQPLGFGALRGLRFGLQRQRLGSAARALWLDRDRRLRHDLRLRLDGCARCLRLRKRSVGFERPPRRAAAPAQVAVDQHTHGRHGQQPKKYFAHRWKIGAAMAASIGGNPRSQAIGRARSANKSRQAHRWHPARQPGVNTGSDCAGAVRSFMQNWDRAAGDPKPLAARCPKNAGDLECS